MIDEYFHFVLLQPWWMIAIVAFGSSFFWPVGALLRVFVNPDLRYTSPLIRSMGWLIHNTGRLWTIGLALMLVVLMLFFWWRDVALRDALGHYTNQRNAFGAGLALGSLFAGVVCFRLIPQWSRGDGLRDIRVEIKKLANAALYDPVKFIDLQQGVFLGLTEKNKPLYVSWNQYRSTHFQLPGASGFGKGTTIGLLAYQSILVGEAVIMFDPKPDDYLPGVFARAAREKGLPLHVLNLRQDQPAQFNPIAGATRAELEEMLIGAMELFDGGTDADFHKGNDRDAAEVMAHLAQEHDVWSIPELFALAANVKTITDQQGFWRKFRHLAGLSAIQTDADMDLAGIIDRGEPLYIIGTTLRDPKVTMLQKLLLVRLIQLIEKRPKDKRRPVMVVLDEFKHQISSVTLTGLGTVRGFNCHMVLAHQSYGDLAENQALNPVTVRGAVIDNTTLKVVYHLKDSELAKQLSETSAKVRTFTENVGQIDLENPKNERTWKEENIPVIDAGVFTHLPSPLGGDGRLRSAVGIAFSDKIATRIAISPVMSNVPPPAVKPRPSSQQALAVNGQGVVAPVISRVEDLI